MLLPFMKNGYIICPKYLDRNKSICISNCREISIYITNLVSAPL